MKLIAVDHKGYYENLDKFIPSEIFYDWDLKALEQFGADLAVYWYEKGSYCGYGYILMYKQQKIYLHCCKHCSCDGPNVDINDAVLWKSLAELKERATPKLLEEIQCLLDVFEKEIKAK